MTVAATAAMGPLAVPLIAPETATAVPPYCSGNTFCMYEGPGFSQSIAYFSPSGRDDNYAAHDGFGPNTFVDGSPLNNNISAVWNNSKRIMVLNQGANTGPTICVGPGVAISDLGAYGYNNNISSHTNFAQEFPYCNTIHGPQGCSI